MSNTVKQLGFIPTNRGEFDTTGQTKYYKDNVVQYRNGSYICSPVGYSSSNPTAYTTDAPYQDGDTQLNPNWKLMASVGLVDAEPVAGSENLVKSGGVANSISEINLNRFLDDITYKFEIFGSIVTDASNISNLVWDGTKVAISNTYRSFIFKVDSTKTYTLKNGDHRILGFNTYPKVNDVPVYDSSTNVLSFSNLTECVYVMINTVRVGETFECSDSVESKIQDNKFVIDNELTKTDLLENATIRQGYYNTSGVFISNSNFSSFEVSVDNSVTLNDVLIQFKILAYGTAYANTILFLHNDNVIGYYTNPNLKEHIVQIPYSTTKILFNLIEDYTPERGDTVYLRSSNMLQHVSGTISKLNDYRRCDKLNNLLRTYSNIAITSDLLSGLVHDGTKVVKSSDPSLYNSLIIEVDSTATYKWNRALNVFGFTEYPEINDIPTLIGSNINTFSNLTTYKYVLINLIVVGAIISYSKNIYNTYNLETTQEKTNQGFTITNLLSEATIRAGYYGSNGIFVSNNTFSSFEVPINPEVNLNEISLKYKILKSGTSLVPQILFVDKYGQIISSYYGDINLHTRDIPYNTTKILVNLLTDYTSSRGDIVSMFTSNTLKQVSHAVSELREISKDLKRYNEYLEIDKTSTNNRIGVWIDNTQSIQSNTYNIKVNFEHPDGVTLFALYKATTAHTDLVSLGNFSINTEYTITKDTEKPVLYIYNSNIVEETTDEYNVETILSVVNEDGVVYKNNILWNNSLADKNIVVFGDSLSAFTDQKGKTWSQYVKEFTGANVINVAVGGTQLRQRVNKKVYLFKDDIQILSGDVVFYQPSGSTIMKYYNCINDHLGVWDDADFTERPFDSITYTPLDIINMITACCDTVTPIENRFDNQVAAARCIKEYGQSRDWTSVISRFSSIDWSTVDAVVILASTNDYGQSTSYGTSGSTDINTTMGAINEMVRIICTTYKQLALYFITPTVHWREYENGQGLPENWCDVYVPSTGEQITRGQFYENVANEFKLNHIPTFSLYKELGWNQYNFSNYFTDNDGTHPTKGFPVMAKKIAAYLEANKSF